MVVEQWVIEIEEGTNRRLVYLKELRENDTLCITPDGVELVIPYGDFVASTGFFKRSHP